MRTFPIYILESPERVIVFVPVNKQDIGHTEFWERSVAAQVAQATGVPLEQIRNIPYALKRARIVPKKRIVFFGESPDVSILRAIEDAVGITGLRFVHDDHETRLPYDRAKWDRLLSQVHDHVSGTCV